MVNQAEQQLENNVNGTDPQETEQDNGLDTGVTGQAAPIVEGVAQEAPQGIDVGLPSSQVEPTVTDVPTGPAMPQGGVDTTQLGSEFFGPTQPVAEPAPVEFKPEDMAGLTDDITRSFVGELQDLARQGIRLDEAQRARTLRGLIEQFKGQAPDSELTRAFRDANQRLLTEANVKDFESLSAQFNKRLDTNIGFINTPSSQLGTQLADGSLTVEELEDMRGLDPAKYEEAIRIKNELEEAMRRNNSINGTPEELTAGLQEPTYDDFLSQTAMTPDEINSFLAGEGNAVELYNRMVKTDDVSQYLGDITGFQDEIAQLQTEFNSIETDLREEFEGRLSSGALNQLIRDRQNPIANQMEVLQNQINGRVGLVDSVVSLNNQAFQVALDERQRIDSIERRNLERQDELDRDAWDNRTQYVASNFDSNTQTYWNNTSMGNKNILGKLHPSAANDVLQIMKEMGDNITVNEIGDGSYQLIDMTTGAMQVYTPAQYSSTPIGTSKLRSGKLNTWDGLATSMGEIKPWSPTFGWFATVGDSFTEIGGEAKGKGNTLVSGIDIDLEIGDDITAPHAGTVTDVQIHKDGNIALTLTTDDGIELFFNHLSGTAGANEAFLDPLKAKGRRVEAGDIIAFGGNTGFVVPSGGGDGSHLDIYGKQNGKLIKLPELAEYLLSGNVPGQPLEETIGDASTSVDFVQAGLGTVGIDFFENTNNIPAALIKEFGNFNAAFNAIGPAYLAQKQLDFDLLGYDISNGQAFLGISKVRKANIVDAITDTTLFLNKMQKVTDDIQDGGIARQSIQGRGAVIAAQITDAMTELKEMYDLGVLNGPDLELLERVVPQVQNRASAKTTSDDALFQLNSLIEHFQENLDNDAAFMGLTPKPKSLTGLSNGTPLQQLIAQDLAIGSDADYDAVDATLGF